MHVASHVALHSCKHSIRKRASSTGYNTNAFFLSIPATPTKHRIMLPTLTRFLSFRAPLFLFQRNSARRHLTRDTGAKRIHGDGALFSTWIRAPRMKDRRSSLPRTSNVSPGPSVLIKKSSAAHPRHSLGRISRHLFNQSTVCKYQGSTRAGGLSRWEGEKETGV